MVAIFGYSRDAILAAVREMYTAVATEPCGPFHFPVGRAACRAVGYPEEVLEALPETAVESFAGVGYPFRADAIRPGDTVLDIGSGSGTDALIASRIVGPRGRVWALDMTPAMAQKLRRLVASLGIANLQVIEGSAEAIPLPDASVDVVTSNGVLNLVPDKRRAAAEIFRVLRPGGRVQIADIVIGRPVDAECHDDPKLWAECVVGATVDEDYLDLFRDAGFADVRVLGEHDYFAHSRNAETRRIARRFGARAIEIAMKRGSRPSRAAALARRLDPRRLLRSLERRGLAGVLALALALAACYGTLAALAMLSLLGVTLVIDEGAWTGTILLFAVLAAAAVAGGYRRHRSAAPPALALGGAVLIGYALYGSYSLAIELAGFALLAAAVYADFRLRRRNGMLSAPHQEEAAGKRMPP
ncbi:MAG: MerC family mercury resistance protein [Pseudomonadota bacterium]